MADARVIERDRRDELGEGLLWSDRDDAVYWTDILGKRVNRLSLSTDAVASWDVPDTIGWLIERRDASGFIAGIGRTMARLTLDPLAVETLAAPEEDRPGNRMNDAKADAAGRIWAGTMPFGGDRPSGAFYRLDPGGKAVRVDDGYRIANGPAIAADGTHLFHTDTGIGTVFRMPINDDESLGARTPFIVFENDWGSPDGMTLDSEGGLWIACWGAGCVTRFVDGKRARSIALPASQITNVTFAGEKLNRMFVTSAAVGVGNREAQAGALFEVEPDCRGLPTHRFAG